ncbi:ABC transporter ATP-binding protein/permease [Rhodococcus sp. SGAir0479]|uniref:ABC transporter ATP-binding protein/permease n=1 Tax=Rhodococcus sp. SGAir0479 TaxID=2567884 RepID=UPI0010CD3FD5|nr:ABC transporter ATP-binding protein/permease [Rhodococcus sp. SGAir0479]QCQ91317.1 ABC transporter ATP-binding protein/permease [Rhodococcus sp. SGAir0479]
MRSEPIDWNHEAVASLLWTARAFAIAIVCLVTVGYLLARHTRWGRQFWTVSGAYFSGRDSRRTWATVAVMLFLAVLGVRLTILLSYQGNEMYTSLQYAAQAFSGGDSVALAEAKSTFWRSIAVFAVLATVHVVRSLLDYYVGQAFVIRWRVWLTDRVASDWLDGRAYYRGRFVDSGIDNPDQRIQADVTDMTTITQSLSMGLVTAVTSVVAFTKILWDLSGPMSLFGVEVPRAMVVLVYVYVLTATVVAFRIGRPLIRLNFLDERLTANFRYALVRLRDRAESVAFYHGETVEKSGLLGRFTAVIANAWRIVFRTLKFNGFNLGVSQVAVVFPLLVQAPRFFAGTITLGDITQSATAFGQVSDSLSFFRQSYDTFAGYRAALVRLDGLLHSDARSRDLPAVRTESVEGEVQLSAVRVERPDGRPLVEDLTLRLAPGDALLVSGPSGSGKTTLLRTLARMWPYAGGTVRRPTGSDALFLSQLPYLPLGDLRAAVAYPARAGDLGDDAIRDVLGKVALGHLVDRLDEHADWSSILSPGEQQRVAFARIVLIRPQVAFLDEATSAVDEGLECQLYRLVREDVPECMIFSVSHRSTVDRHHTRRLELLGNGPWQLSELALS